MMKKKRYAGGRVTREMTFPRVPDGTIPLVNRYHKIYNIINGIDEKRYVAKSPSRRSGRYVASVITVRQIRMAQRKI